MPITSTVQPQSRLYAWDNASFPMGSDASTSNLPSREEGTSTSSAEPPKKSTFNTTPNRMESDRSRLLQTFQSAGLEVMFRKESSSDSESVSVKRPLSGSYEWPSFICTFTINKETGELAWSGAEVDTKRRRKKDAQALSSLFAELNASPAFKAQMKEIAQSLTDGQGFEVKYKMGEQMNRLYNDFQSRFTVTEAFLWKNADLARKRHNEAAETGTDIMVQEDDYVRLDLTSDGKRKGVSVMSAALRGIDKQGSHWDEKTSSDDYARMTEVMPDITIKVPHDKNDSKGKAPATGTHEALADIQVAMVEELQQDSHKVFRAKQANIHARYQAGKIEHSWRALLAYSSGSFDFILKIGKVAAETEAAVLHALTRGQLAWPERNPFNSTQSFDRSNLDQVKRAIWDMTQDQLNNDPDPLAVRLALPWDLLFSGVPVGISMIPGMSQAISSALSILFFGPGELLWVRIAGAFSNHANERELRTELAKVQQRYEESNASPGESRMAALQFMLDHKLISEDALEQWKAQTTSMLGGAMIHQVYERSADLKNAGRIAMRNLFVEMPGWVGGKIGAAMPEEMHTLGTQVSEQTSEFAGAVGKSLGQGLDAAISAGVGVMQGVMQCVQGENYEPDEQAAARYSASLRELSKNTASSIAGIVTPTENNMRTRARLPYPMVLASRTQSTEDNTHEAESSHSQSQASTNDINRGSEQERMAAVMIMHGLR